LDCHEARVSDTPTVAVVGLRAPEAARASAPSPEALLQAALEGDRQAWSELIARHERRVLLSLLAAGVAPAQAREFAQEAWLMLLNRAKARRLQYLQLPGLAIRQALYLARAQGRRPDARVADPAEAPEELDPAATPELLYLSRERLERARARLDGLHHSARSIFLALYQEPQLSHAEVADRVGLSVQRVRQIICEVRKQLRADLEEP
jgi:RNA polymerase sigma-70 factor (ECF subfamily)